MKYSVKGFRDVLPQEMLERVEIEDRLREIYKRWGYWQVETPSVEYFDTVYGGYGEETGESLFRFTDRDGKLIAMRPELTASMARLCAQRLNSLSMPIRLFCMGNVYRNEPTQRGQQKEFRQSDVELFGSDTPEADAEVVALMIESLKELGLPSFKIAIGHLGWLKSVLAGSKISPDGKRKLEAALQSKNTVAVEKVVRETGGDARLGLLASKGEGGKWRDTAQSIGDSELERLLKVDSLLSGYGLKEWYKIDLSLVRNLDYYTGMVFEGFAEGVGFSLCGGGRYDGLMSEMGLPVPAVGFQVGIERLHIALQEQMMVKELSQRSWLMGYGNDAAAAYILAQKLRRAGYGVTMMNERAVMETVAQKASQQELAGYLYLESSGNCICRPLSDEAIVQKEAESIGEILP